MKNQGFTLIEVMVAMSILLISGVAALQVMARTEHTVHIARDRFIGLTVAREGLELVRAVRDTNWFAPADPPVSWAAVLCPDNNEQNFTLDAAMVRASSPEVGDVAAGALYIQPNNEWTHISSGQPSGFSRVVKVDCARYDQDPEYIAVTSRVTWQDQGETRSVDLTQKLYNWYAKPAPL